MSIEKIPELYLNDVTQKPDLFVYDFKMTNNVVNSKVILSMNMFSFLQVGKKQVHTSDTSVMVNKQQSLLLKRGNWLWTELLDKEVVYYCKLLFFSEEKLSQFLDKHGIGNAKKKREQPHFVIQNDSYLASYISSLTIIMDQNPRMNNELLSIKFEELLLYLIQKYGSSFESFLHSLVIQESSSFKRIVESKVDSNLKLEEIAFLCNMSLSTFKRHFSNEFEMSPGKWLQGKRLQKAKQLLETGKYKPSEVYLKFGYNNLSNFSVAFKKKFGMNPRYVG